MTIQATSTLDVNSLHEFVGVLFDETDWVEFRAIRPGQRGAKSCYSPAHEIPASVLHWIEVHCSARYAGMYVGANPRKPRPNFGPGKASNENDVATYRCAFVDLDNCAPENASALIAQANLPEPTLIVHSGRDTGTHLYWRINEAMDRETWEGAQRALQKRLSGDSVKDPPRVMRLPGTFNFTRGNMARVLCTGPRYETAAELGITADEMQPPTFEAASNDIAPDERNLNFTTRRYLNAERIPEGGDGDKWVGRNHALFSTACDFIANNFGIEATLARLMPLAVERDGLSEREAKRTIQNAARRNPSRTLLAGVNAIDMTLTEVMELTLTSGRGMAPPDAVAEHPNDVPDLVRVLRPMNEEETARLHSTEAAPHNLNGSLPGSERAPDLAVEEPPVNQHSDTRSGWKGPVFDGPKGVRIAVADVVGNEIVLHVGDGNGDPFEVTVKPNATGLSKARTEIAGLFEIVQRSKDAKELRRLFARDITPSTMAAAMKAHREASATDDKRPRGEEIVYRAIVDAWQPAFVVGDYVWCEATGRFHTIDRVTKMTVSSTLVDKVMARSCDFSPSEDGRNVDIARVRALFAVQGGNLRERLPDREAAANLGPDSARARFFAQQIERVFGFSGVWMKLDDDAEDRGAARTTLGLKAWQRANNVNFDAFGKWCPAHWGIDCWFRVDEKPSEDDPEVKPRLALHASTFGANKPHGCDAFLNPTTNRHGPDGSALTAAEFAVLCGRYGITDSDPEVARRLAGGRRLVVLNPELTARIFEQAREAEKSSATMQEEPPF